MANNFTQSSGLKMWGQPVYHNIFIAQTSDD